MNAPPERLLKFGEVAARFGVSERKVYRLIHDGLLKPPVKLGRAARIPESEVIAFIETLKGRRGVSFTP